MDCPICESINPVEFWLENGRVIKRHYCCNSCGWTEDSDLSHTVGKATVGITNNSVGEFFRHVFVWVKSWRNIRKLLRKDEDFEPKG